MEQRQVLGAEGLTPRVGGCEQGEKPLIWKGRNLMRPVAAVTHCPGQDCPPGTAEAKAESVTASVHTLI